MMTTTKTNTAAAPQLILELLIDANGTVTRTVTKTDARSTLEGTLLSRLYPGIRVARVGVPDELDTYEQSIVENSMSNLVFEGVSYKLIGASGAAKEGRFYFVDAPHAEPLAERFQRWPQAAITYFSILMTDCKVVIDEAFARVLVVEDHVLGTNDCRGWIRESLYAKLNLPADRFVQFRLAFDDRAPKQAKGAFKIMTDSVADRLAVDIVIPKSSIKPGLKDAPRRIPGIGVSGNLYHGSIVLGTKAVSRVSEMGSSYTLLEHASKESLESEIFPAALEQISTLRSAWDNGDYEGLFRFMNRPYIAAPEEETTEDENNTASAAPSMDDMEWDPVEAALLADRSGMVIHIPYVSNYLNRKLARKAYRILTGGGFSLPSFALADDGILFEYQGSVFAASDWIAEEAAITSLTADKSLTIRYPIRMKEDLLPVRHLTDADLVPALTSALGTDSLPSAVIDSVLVRQLRMEGVYVLHSKTAAKNGGDFDFDTICAMPSDRFPKFVESRISYREQFQPVVKTKKKAKSPWWNMQLVAMNARGNKVGMITDLKTSCLAAGRSDLAYSLVEQLQNALDSLKHDVRVDGDVVSAIRKEVDQAPWLKFKRERMVSDLPMQLEVSASDVVGQFYNMLRPILGDFSAEARPIKDFRGLFQGQTVTKEMFEECTNTNFVYGLKSGQAINRNNDLKAKHRVAHEAWVAVRKSDNQGLKKDAMLRRNAAQGALRADEERFKGEISFLCRLLQHWAVGKQENRNAWAQAMASVVTSGTGSGGVLFNTFPQEFCDLLAQNTGGKSVKVRMPQLPDGYCDWQGRTMVRVQPYKNLDGTDGKHTVSLFTLTDDRQLDFSQTAFHK